MAKITGGCACGKVRYTVEGRLGYSLLCQCRDCQHFSGTGHAALALVLEEEIALDGELKFHTTQAASGNKSHRGFCPTCGSPVINRADRIAGKVWLHAASLDDPTIFKPAKVVYGEAAQPWDPAKATE